MIFLGLWPSSFWPLSDSFGRKPVVYMGFALFIAASFICVNARSHGYRKNFARNRPFCSQNDEYCHYSICTVEIIWRVSCPL
jgi:MFS family permease